MTIQDDTITAWGTRRVEAVGGNVTISQILCEILESLGVEQAFAIVGGGNAPFAEALLKSPIELIHARHEGGAAFAATEASMVSGRPTAVTVTTGPGLLNALTGICGARWDGAKVILFSGISSFAHKGRGAVQETSSYTMPSEGLFRAGPFFDFAVELNDSEELPEIARRLAIGCQRPGGFVAHIALPLRLQTTLIPARGVKPASRLLTTGGDPAAARACAARLNEGHFAVWVGHGARHASEPLRELVDRTGAGVLCTPRAKGIFPEDHPQFIGVTGAGGHSQVREYLRSVAPREILVLGTRMGESSSWWEPELAPPRGFIQVDLDVGAFGSAYPQAPVLAVHAEIGSFLRSLVEVVTPPQKRPKLKPLGKAAPIDPRPRGSVRPQYLMQVIQRRVVEESDALLMTESGNAFAWGNHFLRFTRPGQYRTSAQYGAMGQVVAGVVGAALARRGRAVAVVGDGAMLMNNEISTAVKYGAKALWIVLNDQLYGITHQAMLAWGFQPVETELPATDFVGMARSLGADGAKVTSEPELDSILCDALSAATPFVLDVAISREEISPVVIARINQLRQQQGANSKKS